MQWIAIAKTSKFKKNEKIVREKKLKFLLEYKFSGWKTYIKEEMKQEKEKKRKETKLKKKPQYENECFQKQTNQNGIIAQPQPPTTNQWNKSSVYFAQEKRIFHSILTLSSLFTLLQPWCFFFFWWSFYSASTLILFILHFYCVGFSFHQK